MFIYLLCLRCRSGFVLGSTARCLANWTGTHEIGHNLGCIHLPPAENEEMETPEYKYGFLQCAGDEP